MIFQENRSFDTYFGPYPGANDFITTFPIANPTDPAVKPANQKASYVQFICNMDGAYGTISPFFALRPHR